ncbi:hypothetical protein BGZ76_008758 [Entomortierella beljakovae]|nr:hypothetical protein BGZ76_008758 [Entomortierella beljakovae]
MYFPYSEVKASNSTSLAVISPMVSLETIKRETPSPTVTSIALESGISHYQTPATKILSGTTTLASSTTSHSNFSVYADSPVQSCSSSPELIDNRDYELRRGSSGQLPYLLDISSPPSSFNSHSRSRPRPRSMIVSSASVSSPSLISPLFTTQPYTSPFHNDSLSMPGSPSSGLATYQRHDRRRSSTGPYYGPLFPTSTSSSPTSFSSNTFGSDKFVYQDSQHQQSQSEPSQQQQQQQQQRQLQQQVSQVQYHPQQQHLQHLLDPSMVPEITDIHVCPVCQRRFTRPFNLRSHIMTHTTARPYPCDECHWKFTRQHDLLRHKRAKHPGSVPPLQPKVPKVK